MYLLIVNALVFIPMLSEHQGRRCHSQILPRWFIGTREGGADTAAIPTLFPIAKPPVLPHLSFI
jgi:hypothetical protein